MKQLNFMSLTIIKEKILAEANKEREMILEEAKEEAEKIRSEGERQITKLQEDFAAEVKKSQGELAEQTRIQAELAVRNNLLQKKQGLVDKVFVLVLRGLAEKEEGRTKLLRKCLGYAQGELGRKIEIISTPKDKKILEKLLANFPHFKLGKKVIKGEGGFLAVTPEAEVDYTWESIIAEKREELASAVAKILFK